MPILETEKTPQLRSFPACGRDIVVFDLEFTSWEGTAARNWSGPAEWREVVDIGAVRLSAAGLVEMDSFSALVKPERNPALSGYFSDLTGIRQIQIDLLGHAFPMALAAFLQFASGAVVLSNGDDTAILRENCLFAGIEWPSPDCEFFDVNAWLCGETGLSRTDCVSGHLPERLGYPPARGIHTGLGDARAIATALRHIQGAPCTAAR